MATAPIRTDPIPADLLLTRPWLRQYEPGVPVTLTYPEIPVHGLLDQTVARVPDRTATIFMGARLTYRQLGAAADRFAAALQGLGVQKGDRVAVMLPNCPQFVITYFGALKAGAVVVPTNPLYVEREVEHQIKDSGAQTAIVLSRVYGTVAGVADRVGLRSVIVANIKEYFPPHLRLLFTLLKERKEGHRVTLVRPGRDRRFLDVLSGAGTPRPVDVRPDDLALLQYTGGTTGVPKGAMLTHRNLVANTKQVGARFVEKTDGRDAFLSVLPFFHVYGMTVSLLLSVDWGAANVILPRFDLKQTLTALDRYQPTIFPGVPTLYNAVASAPDVHKYRIRSVRACISGAAPLPQEVQERFETLTGARLVEGYGLTEAAPVTHCNPIGGLRKAGSIGIPMPDTDARIVDLETGERELPPGEVGELVLRGPQVMRGYWNRPDETAQVLRNGWLSTGDIARRDEDGYFFIVDRKKDMIDVGGFKVYPRDVEEVLYQHPKVQEAVVVGIPDAHRGETVKAFVVLKPGEACTVDEILAHCRANLTKYKVPTAVAFRESLPKTLVGKFLRRALLEEEMAKQQAAG
ncbi:MAG: long-chain fatty acid--CoA ligase [Chloroflexi bacterium]|nr:long-chain fatty acid--CoA ligase [Chloroflexota bacterium]